MEKAHSYRKTDPFQPVIGKGMETLFSYLEVFAKQEETILISGASGVGKSRAALWCHKKSPRRENNFETVQLMTLPENLQMGELFGWRKGAFTGASSENKGALGRAQGGTLFIDEIDKLSLKSQAGLLHVLETRKFRPLGKDSQYLDADVRFLIGTNVDLKQNVKQGGFREDLFYRINILPVRVPSLKEREEEIPDWANYMAEQRHKEARHGGNCEVTPAGVHILSKQEWPGNLRQLDNTIRRAYAIALADSFSEPKEVFIDVQHIQQALDLDSQQNGNALIEALKIAAQTFVDEAIEHFERDNSSLDLSLSDSFRSFVLLHAIERFKEPKKVYRLFGKDNLIKNRNYHRDIKREIEKMKQFMVFFDQSEEEISKLITYKEI